MKEVVLLFGLVLVQGEPLSEKDDTRAWRARLETVTRLEQEAIALRPVLARVIESLRHAASRSESGAALQEMPALANLTGDLPSRARLIEEFMPPETLPGGVTLERILSSFSDEEARLSELRDRLARGEVLSLAEMLRALRSLPAAAAPLVAPASETPSETLPALPRGSPVLHALVELEEHRVVPLRAVWDRKRSEILATLPENDPSAAAIAGRAPEGEATSGSEGNGPFRSPDLPVTVSNESLDPLAAGEALYRMGRHAEALAAFSAITSVPQGMESYLLYYRAACHRELGQFSEALDLLAEAASRSPGDEWGARARRVIPLVKVKKNLENLKTRRSLNPPSEGSKGQGG
ncbi:MAG: tetratricopeptide repeat protein [Planctomycetota bacterium]